MATAASVNDSERCLQTPQTAEDSPRRKQRLTSPATAT